jgi:hypothetical protein
MAFVLVAGPAACTTATHVEGAPTDPAGPQASPTVPASECADRCLEKLVSCGAPADLAEMECEMSCDEGLTEQQLACVERASCARLGDAEDIDELCAGTSSSTGGGGGASGTGGSSGGGASSGNPEQLTIRGRFGATKAVHVEGSGGTIASHVSVAPAPQFSPSKPSELPVLSQAASVEITSPSLGGCAASISWTLNGSQIGVQVTGQDALPSTACVTFTDAVAKSGVRATLSDVPYPNGGSATVSVELTP